MQRYKSLADVVALAEFAHRNQTDKAGMPYIEHPRRVMQSVQVQGAMPYVQMAAILHDVTEDTAFTTDMLLSLGIPEAAVDIVRLVDRSASLEQWQLLHEEYSNHESFPDSTTFYYDQIACNPGAKMVKLADIHDNLQEWRLSYLPAETQTRLRDKYAKAKKLLGVR